MLFVDVAELWIGTCLIFLSVFISEYKLALGKGEKRSLISRSNFTLHHLCLDTSIKILKGNGCVWDLWVFNLWDMDFDSLWMSFIMGTWSRIRHYHSCVCDKQTVFCSLQGSQIPGILEQDKPYLPKAYFYGMYYEKGYLGNGESPVCLLKWP